MDNGDEAVEAAVRAILAMPGALFKDDCHADHIQSAGCPVCKGDVPAMVREAYPLIAAAVRAEAVADERRRVERALELLDEWIEGGELVAWAMAVRDVLAPESAPQSTELSRSIYASFEADLAAGSVPVATPEPTGQSRCDLIVCSHCLLTPAEIDALDHHSGGWCPGRVATPPARSVGDVLAADITGDLPPDRVVNTRPAPSQPVTCEHGKTRQHYDFLTGCRCAGPVSVPKESSE